MSATRRMHYNQNKNPQLAHLFTSAGVEAMDTPPVNVSMDEIPSDVASKETPTPIDNPMHRSRVASSTGESKDADPAPRTDSTATAISCLCFCRLVGHVVQTVCCPSG